MQDTVDDPLIEEAKILDASTNNGVKGPVKMKQKNSNKPAKTRLIQTSAENIDRQIISSKCCKANCLTKVLEKCEILETRMEFQEKSRDEQAQWLLNFFEISKRIWKGRIKYDYYVKGKRICQKAWIFSYGIAYGR